MLMNLESLTTAADRGDRFTVDGYPGMAWHFLHAETRPDEDTEWSGYEQDTGRAVMVMVGDDRRFSIDPEDVRVVPEDDYCHVCGQVGCAQDGRA